MEEHGFFYRLLCQCVFSKQSPACVLLPLCRKQSPACVFMFSILSALLLVKVLFVFVFVLHCYAPVWLPYRKVEHVAVNVSVMYSCRSLYVVTDEGLRLKPTHCHSCLSDNIMSTHHIRLN